MTDHPTNRRARASRSRNYVFLKMGPDVPTELREAMKQAGPEGLVILERPEGRPSCGASPWQSTQVLAVSPGPHTPARVLQLLDKHARPAGWDVKLSSTR